MVCGFAAGLLLLPAISAKAATAEQEYSACLAVARTNPDVAGDTARAWQQRGGGAPARHCEAYALFALGRFADAAALFQSLATELSAATPGLQRDALIQAGQAWLLAGDAPRAIKAASAALAIAPDDADLLTDRAIARASAGQYWEAIDDLNRALELTPDRADILAFRASAYRHVGSLELAAEDAVRAIEINPLHVEALLELGMVTHGRQ